MAFLPAFTIQYNGMFDFDGLYAAVTDWGKNYGYYWFEREYKHKTADGAEQEIAWVLNKRVTEYVEFNIIIEVHTYDIYEAEVDQGNNKKKLLANGRIFIRILPELKFDWQKQFSGSSFAKKLGEWYSKLRQKDLSNYEDMLFYRCQDPHALIKKYLDLQTKKYSYKNYLEEN